MPGMTTAERVELALIPIAGVVIWLIGGRLPAVIGTGSLLLASSVLLLSQGLIRDLWLLYRRNQALRVEPRQHALCMCVESTVGVVGVVAGLIILGSAVDATVTMSPWRWIGLVIVVLAVGFAIKDFVFEWRPFRLRRDKDHVNLVFSWKR